RAHDMYYILSKAIWLITAPGSFLVLLSTGAVLWALFRGSRSAIRLCAASLIGLLILSFTPASLWLAQPLQTRFPRWHTTDQAEPYGIIALGGDRGGRFNALVELSRRFPQAKLIFTGAGEPAWSWDDLPRRFARSGGDPKRLILETRSRNTDENARYSAELLRPTPDQRWLIITSAAHMPRAIGCFRHAGFQSEAYPVEFTTKDRADLFTEFPTGSEAIFLFDLAAKEWIGLLVYRLTGKTDTLLPAP